jgi:hypothetical protein
MIHRLALLACLALVCSGCSRPEVPLESVAGRVTLGGGEWPTGGSLTFAPVESDAGVPKVPGWADFPADGHFIAQCSLGDGLPPGKYVVNVVCREAASHDAKPAATVAASYQKKPHEVVVAAGKENELVLDIPKK